MAENKVSKVDYEINLIYVLTQAFELIMRDFERRLNKDGFRFVHEKKRQFNRLLETTRNVVKQYELLYSDIMEAAEPKGWQELDMWAKDANSLARMLLLWGDKCGPYPDNEEMVFDMMMAFKGEGIVDEEMLQKFYLR